MGLCTAEYMECNEHFPKRQRNIDEMGSRFHQHSQDWLRTRLRIPCRARNWPVSRSLLRDLLLEHKLLLGMHKAFPCPPCCACAPVMDTLPVEFFCMIDHDECAHLSFWCMANLRVNKDNTNCPIQKIYHHKFSIYKNLFKSTYV